MVRVCIKNELAAGRFFLLCDDHPIGCSSELIASHLKAGGEISLLLHISAEGLGPGSCKNATLGNDQRSADGADRSQDCLLNGIGLCAVLDFVQIHLRDLSVQNSRFQMAELKTELELAQTFVDRQVELLNAGDLTAEDASMAKWWCTEMQNRLLDRCLQLFGGYGYMKEYPIARAWLDARIQTIYGGTSEIMKEIVGRGLGLADPKK